ncbi:MAG: sugar phosphate isomerase/epimerase, partial [Planctomycetota bacterium]|nr:sugar phosphate isomerase/epimerase [Planctomycetota bacterium]
MSQISFSTLACPQWGWVETARRAAEYGYDGVEVRMIAGEVDLLARPEMAPGRRAESRRGFGDLGIRVCGLASSVRFDYATCDERQSQVDIGRRNLDLARDLGAGFVRVFGDVLPPAGDSAARLERLHNIADGLRSLGEYALSTTPTVRVVMETHGDFSDSILAAELFELVPHPMVGLLWDTHHPWRFHGEPLDETWRRLRSRVWHTHWKDSATNQTPRPSPENAPAIASTEAIAATEKARQLMSGHRDAQYVLFGEGDFPATECLRLLSEGGYSGWYSL